MLYFHLGNEDEDRNRTGVGWKLWKHCLEEFHKNFLIPINIHRSRLKSIFRHWHVFSRHILPYSPISLVDSKKWRHYLLRKNSNIYKTFLIPITIHRSRLELIFRHWHVFLRHILPYSPISLVDSKKWRHYLLRKNSKIYKNFLIPINIHRSRLKAIFRRCAHFLAPFTGFFRHVVPSNTLPGRAAFRCRPNYGNSSALSSSCYLAGYCTEEGRKRGETSSVDITRVRRLRAPVRSFSNHVVRK